MVAGIVGVLFGLVWFSKPSPLGKEIAEAGINLSPADGNGRYKFEVGDGTRLQAFLSKHGYIGHSSNQFFFKPSRIPLLIPNRQVTFDWEHCNVIFSPDL